MSDVAEVIKSAIEPTTQFTGTECKTDYRPTVRVDCNLKYVVNEQTGYKRMYILPPLQVLIFQAFLRGLAEVGIIWNLLGRVSLKIKSISYSLVELRTFVFGVKLK